MLLLTMSPGGEGRGEVTPCCAAGRSTLLDRAQPTRARRTVDPGGCTSGTPDLRETEPRVPAEPEGTERRGRGRHDPGGKGASVTRPRGCTKNPGAPRTRPSGVDRKPEGAANPRGRERRAPFRDRRAADTSPGRSPGERDAGDRGARPTRSLRDSAAAPAPPTGRRRRRSRPAATGGPPTARSPLPPARTLRECPWPRRARRGR